MASVAGAERMRREVGDEIGEVSEGQMLQGLVSHQKDFGFYCDGMGSLCRILGRDV